MMTLPAALKQNIVKILVAVRSLRRAAQKHEMLNGQQIRRISYACAEVAFSSFVASSELEGLKDQDNVLIQKEVVSCLDQIAAACLDVQDWQKSDEIRRQLLSLRAPCAYIAQNVGLPELAEDGELGMVPFTPSVTSTVAVSAGQEEETDQIEKLKAEIAALREILTTLVIERDHLLGVTCPEIEAAYLRELGGLEVEVFYARYEARMLKRVMELMRASINRNEHFDAETVFKTVREEEAQYRAFCDELHKKAAAAAAAAELQKQRQNGTEETSQEAINKAALLKKLYRRIVKEMHPDLHPDQDEATRDLFKKANAAYEQGDLKTLQEIAAMLDGETPEDKEQLLASLKAERDQLLAMVKAIREEIDAIKHRYPYTKKAVLDDKERLTAEKARLQEELQREKQAAARYKRIIMEMEEQWKN